MPAVKKVEPSDYASANKEMKRMTGIVLVFHPGCGHCVAMRPDWEEMKRQAPLNAKIIEVNGEGFGDNPMMSSSEIGKNTEGFPTIMRMENGRVVEKFDKERNVPNMLEFVKKHAQAQMKNLNRSNSANKMKRKSRKTKRRVRKGKKRI